MGWFELNHIKQMLPSSHCSFLCPRSLIYSLLFFFFPHSLSIRFPPFLFFFFFLIVDITVIIAYLSILLQKMSYAFKRVGQKVSICSSLSSSERRTPALHRPLAIFFFYAPVSFSFRPYHYPSSSTSASTAADSTGSHSFQGEVHKHEQNEMMKENDGDTVLYRALSPRGHFTIRGDSTKENFSPFPFSQRSLHSPFKFRARSSSSSPLSSSILVPAPAMNGANGYGSSPSTKVMTQVAEESNSMKDRASLSSFFSDRIEEETQLRNLNAISLSSPSSVVGTSTEEATQDGGPSSVETDKLSLYAQHRIQDVSAPQDTTGMNEVEIFMEHVELQTEASRFERNQQIPYPDHPDALIPAFRRVKRHEKQTVIASSPVDDRPEFTRRDFFVQPPPSPSHPWVGPHTPIGEHIVHGDGQLKVVGTGEVGFEDSGKDGAAYDQESKEERKQWKGLKHHSILQLPLPSLNAIAMNPDMRIKYSFSLTGRGVFATHPIAKGETIMVVASTARNVGVKGEIARLEEMCTFILQRALQLQDGEGIKERESEEYLVFLHDWILSGQPSPLMEHWPKASTGRVIASIGGIENLYRLELHPIHIARMAAIMDLNSFLVESSFAERKGMSYFPEAGFLNHSCVPNAVYEVMPAHMYEGSDYSIDEQAKRKKEEEVKIEAEEDEKDMKARMHHKNAKGNPKEEPHSQSSSSAVILHTPLSMNVLSPSAQLRAIEREVILSSGKGNELTEYGAPEYLFCCRAEKDIAAGEEILISYVPQEWSFDNRQYVLHDRYRFYCKCPRCAPTIDSQYSRVPRLVVFLVFCSIGMQLLIMRMRNNANRAFDDDDGAMDEQEHESKPPKRMGLFELLKKEEANEINSYSGIERLPSHIRDDYGRK